MRAQAEMFLSQARIMEMFRALRNRDSFYFFCMNFFGLIACSLGCQAKMSPFSSSTR